MLALLFTLVGLLLGGGAVWLFRTSPAPFDTSVRSVSSGPELQAALASLADGETVRLEPGVFHVDRWLTVTADGVTIRGAGPRASVVRVVDGAGVGGFVAGDARPRRESDTVSHLTIRDLGFDGNSAGQDTSAKRLHGVDLRNCRHCRIENVRVTRTSPKGEHATGGSGITVGRRSRHVTLRDLTVEAPGDRGVQIGGEHVRVLDSTFLNSFDRHVSFDYLDRSDSWWVGKNVTVRGNTFGANRVGSHVGVSQVSRRPDRGDWIVSGNQSMGRKHKSFVVLGRCFRDTPYSRFVISDNTMRKNGRSNPYPAVSTRCFPGRGLIQGNVISGPYTVGIRLNEGRSIQALGNTLRGQDTGIVVQGVHQVQDNLITRQHTGVQVGIKGRAVGALISGNNIFLNRGSGIVDRSRGKTVIKNNVLRDNNQSGAGHAEVDVSRSGDNRITDNVVWKLMSGGELIRGGSDDYVEGNHLFRSSTVIDTGSADDASSTPARSPETP